MTLQKSALYVSAEKIVIFDLKRACHSHFGKVNRPQSQSFRRIRKETLFSSVFLIKMAERGGFEPPVRCWRTHAFQACTLSHSDISPKGNLLLIYYQNFARVIFIFRLKNFYPG